MEQKPAIASRTWWGNILSLLGTLGIVTNLFPETTADEWILLSGFVIGLGVIVWGRYKAGPIGSVLESTTFRSLLPKIAIFILAWFKVSIGDSQADLLIATFLSSVNFGSTLIGRLKQGGIGGVITAPADENPPVANWTASGTH